MKTFSVVIVGDRVGQWVDTGLLVADTDEFYMSVHMKPPGVDVIDTFETTLISFSRDRLLSYVNTSDVESITCLVEEVDIYEDWKVILNFSVRKDGDDWKIMFRTSHPSIYDFRMSFPSGNLLNDVTSDVSFGVIKSPCWTSTGIAVPSQKIFYITPECQYFLQSPTLTISREALLSCTRAAEGEYLDLHGQYIVHDFGNTGVSDSEIYFTVQEDDDLGYEILFMSNRGGNWKLNLISDL